MKALTRDLACLVIIFSTAFAHAKRAPNFELTDLSGKTHHIAELRGSITVVNFWATWCGPCQAELPMLSSLTSEYGAKKVRFIAISADEAKNRKKVDEFLAHNSLAMDVWLGADLDMLERAGLGNVLPATLILDENGEVIARVMGQAREQDIRQPLDWLIAGKTGPTPAATVKHY